MRFDDSLTTVLSGEASTGFGASATWRQLVDLVGRRRTAADETTIARLRLLRQAIPAGVRAASARALAVAHPPAALVRLFAEDELAIAGPVLRTAMMSAAEWIDLLPRLSPVSRSILRHRRDLPIEVVRALETFGSVDFLIEGTSAPLPADSAASEPIAATRELPRSIDAPLSETPFVALGDVAGALPLVAEARRRMADPAPAGYAISDLVARIDAFTRSRSEPDAVPAEPDATGSALQFRYETDALGVVRWVDGVGRPALIGLGFAVGGAQGPAQMDASVVGAFRRRARFVAARLVVDGRSDAAGDWRISGMPFFDQATGRFLGYRGSARRPRADESAAPTHAKSDSLRQIAHELRTPTNAIAGFAELIEGELLGPVPQGYRDRAATIRAHAADLIVAIEDLDTAARIDADALDLQIDKVDLTALTDRLLADLAPLAALRGVVPTRAPDRPSRLAAVDDRAAERLVGRLLSAILSVAVAGEAIGIRVRDLDDAVGLEVDRPRLLAEVAGNDPPHAPDDAEGGRLGAPLLGTDFALRLARNLARELGGSLFIGEDRLTLRLPAALDHGVGRTTTL